MTFHIWRVSSNWHGSVMKWGNQFGISFKPYEIDPSPVTTKNTQVWSLPFGEIENDNYPATYHSVSRTIDCFYHSGWHYHANKHQILVSISGPIRVDIEGSVYLIKPMQGVIIPAKHKHNVTMYSGNIKFISLYIQKSVPIKGRVIEAQSSLDQAVAYALFSSSNLFSESTQTKLIQVIANWPSINPQIAITPTRKSDIKHLRWLDKNIHKRASHHELSLYTGLKERANQILFKDAFGKSFKSVRDELQTLYAFGLLVQAGETVCTVSAKLGFSHSGDFEKMFHAITGYDAKEIEGINHTHCLSHSPTHGIDYSQAFPLDSLRYSTP